VDSPVSRISSFQDSFSKNPSQSKVSALMRTQSDKLHTDSYDALKSPASNASLELHETPTNYSLEEGSNTIETRNEADFASFLHKDAIQERYLTPTPNRKSRYDDLQLSLDKDPPNNASQILSTVEEEILEDIEVAESYDKLDEELGIASRRLRENRTPSFDTNMQSIVAPPQTPSKSGRSSFNVKEFKKNLQTFNKENSLPQKKESNININNDNNHHQVSPSHTDMIKYKHAACVIQRWWRQIKAEQRQKVSVTFS
jgi:hypothetical protein